MRIFGSAIDIASTRGSTGTARFACISQTRPMSMPAVRQAKPPTMARPFIWSSTASDGSRA
jgi:hypothetical protein